MKLLGITILIMILLLIAFQIYFTVSNRSIEKYPYTVNKKYEKFEVRTYESRLFSSVKLPGNDYKKSSGQGFTVLAGYIFGGNDKNQKISMTSPVSISIEDSMTMQFMVPKEFNQTDLPQPNDTKIKFVTEPEKIVAAIQFGGWANSEKIKKHQQQLIQFLDKEGINYSGKFYFLGYNAPFEMFNRKNEVIVELCEVNDF